MLIVADGDQAADGVGKRAEEVKVWGEDMCLPTPIQKMIDLSHLGCYLSPAPAYHLCAQMVDLSSCPAHPHFHHLEYQLQ
uniref:Uncharacterized protein n=1 Tax=Picea glauca TaxID=3330 RepID=A0A117NJ13_PICGL|nr:hypothetical protein ABT39_MTgene609 [Picea glauca]